MDGYHTMTENAGSKISCHYPTSLTNTENARYVDEIEILGLFCLLLIEMWHGGEVFENQKEVITAT